MKSEELIEKHALANAVQHNGKASMGAVMGRVLADDPALKKNISKLQEKLAEIVKKVNRMNSDEQENRLLKLWPDFFKPKEKSKEPRELPYLPGAKMGKVVTRLGPEPNGYLHIGHAISFFFNEYYAKKYKGKLILRFEDTNPEKEKKEFYDSIAEDLAWLGIIYNERKNNSDDLKLFYKKAEELIKSGNAYVCSCPVEVSRKNRFEGIECGCRNQDAATNLKLWKGMLKDAPAGTAVLRLKADMQSRNTVMRDPTLFRIVEAEHPMQVEKYRVWPLYDFANAVEDGICGVTHVLRSNEFKQRDELQNKIRDLLGLTNPVIISYSRITASGAPTSKREIAPLIESGAVTGWDDPRLVTLKGLRRRGILPETLRLLALEVRMTKGSTTIDYKTIFGINRRILDEQAARYFFVPNPVKLNVKNAPGKTAELKMHPNYPERGTRKIKTSDTFYISAEDEDSFKRGEWFRLKDLFNVRYMGKGKSEFDSLGVKPDTRKIQWVTKDYTEIEVIVPGEIGKGGLKKVKGFAEKSVEKIKPDSIVQFERFGFCKKNSDGTFVLAHK
ncbi:MAG: glutamate--tRNA ligase [archaeon]